MTRQFIEVAFKPGGKTYCYHNDGEPVAVGDKVKVEARDEGWTAVEVRAIRETPPAFETKAILGRAA